MSEISWDLGFWLGFCYWLVFLCWHENQGSSSYLFSVLRIVWCPNLPKILWFPSCQQLGSAARDSQSRANILNYIPNSFRYLSQADHYDFYWKILSPELAMTWALHKWSISIYFHWFQRRTRRVLSQVFVSLQFQSWSKLQQCLYSYLDVIVLKS